MRIKDNFDRPIFLGTYIRGFLYLYTGGVLTRFSGILLDLLHVSFAFPLTFNSIIFNCRHQHRHRHRHYKNFIFALRILGFWKTRIFISNAHQYSFLCLVISANLLVFSKHTTHYITPPTE